MKITIHRGLNQIGGCITEISTEKTRILIDLGQNLPDNQRRIDDILEKNGTIETLTEGVHAIFYSHYHGDHIGWFKRVKNGTDQYIGKIACKVMYVKYAALKQDDSIEKLSSFKTFIAKERISVNGGNIVVTPYFVSHSACDAYMFLIEADGKRILHTGDFRDHGYLGEGLVKTIRKYIGQVDFLITEGTMLSRSSEKVLTESELMRQAAKVMKDSKYVFVLCSSTDIDRLVTFRKATPKNRIFVCDTYQNEVLKVFTDTLGKHFPIFRFEDVSVFPRQNLLADMLDKGFCALVRVGGHTLKGKYGWFIDRVINQIPPDKRSFIYSMWSGYVREGEHQKKEYIEFRNRFSKVADIHTSGHATKECLAEVCTLTNPAVAIIPIHSEKSDEYLRLPISEELKAKVVLASCEIDGNQIEIKNM